MLHYTSYNGNVHHFQHWPGLEEQVVGDDSYYVAVSPLAFEDGVVLAACRHKPGVIMAKVRYGDNGLTIFSKDEFVPTDVLVEVAKLEETEQ